MENKRNIFITEKLRIATGLAFVHFLVFLFLWQKLPVWFGKYPFLAAQDFSFALNSLIYIGAASYVFIILALSYLWSRKKYELILNRINGICRKAAASPETCPPLKFRKSDEFSFFAETFNAYIRRLEEDRSHLSIKLESLRDALKELPESPTPEQLDRLYSRFRADAE